MKKDKLFTKEKPVIGMIHTNHTDEESSLQLAQREIEIYLKYGVYPLIENYFGDDDDCENILRWMQQKNSDGVIVGSWFKDNHRAEYSVNEDNVKDFMLRWNAHT